MAISLSTRPRLPLVMITIGPALVADSIPFTIHPGDHGALFTVFPLAGKETTIPAPPGLSNIGRVFGSDGKTFYVLDSGGMWKNDLKPARSIIVPGTSGFTAVWHFTLSQDRIFISGIWQRHLD
jgi:hypothetical protein